jgi:dihydrofolate reductase
MAVTGTPSEPAHAAGAGLCLALVVAMGRNRAIGRANTLPWRLPEDMAYFKRLTMGHPIIMGRKTFESIGRALPGRRNIVVTRQPGWQADGTETASSLDAALALCSGAGLAFLIGGAELYRAGLARATRLFITEIDREYAADTFFPELPAAFRETAREHHQAQSDPSLGYAFVIYER